mgnify:CR=1 FL=1
MGLPGIGVGMMRHRIAGSIWTQVAESLRVDRNTSSSPVKRSKLDEQWTGLVNEEDWRLVFEARDQAGLDYESKCVAQLSMLNALIRIFEREKGVMLPVIYQAVSDAWWLALSLEQEVGKGAASRVMEDTARTIHRAFTTSINERSQSAISSFRESRRAGAFHLAAILLRIYFHLGQLNLINNILRAMQAAELLNQRALFPKSDIITFDYFIARYYLSRDEFDLAEEYLLEAAQLCPSRCSQLSCILQLLVPLKMLQHRSKPLEPVIEKLAPHFKEFCRGLIDLIQKGQVNDYAQAIEQNQWRLVKQGTFGIYERLMHLVLLRHFIRIHRALDGEARLPLKVLLPKGTGWDTGRLAGLLAVQIERGWIKGYLSQEREYLVLSQREPFP